MPNDCIIPTPAEIVAVGARIIPYRRKDLVGINDLMPMKYVNNTHIIINRPDIIRGLQPWRGLGGEPPVTTDQFNRDGEFCLFWPGYWGETKMVTESELANVAEPGTCPGQPLDARKEIARIQNRLTYRMLMRMEKLVWDTLRTGRYVAMNEAGRVIFEQFFNIRMVRATVDFTDLVNSRPLSFFRSLPEIFRDTSAMFTGDCVRYYMNRTTLNRILENSNGLDLGRGNLSACCNTIGLDWVNAQFASQGLGRIVIYDNRWVDEQGGIHLFIPDGWVIIKGCRPDAVVPGHYYLTKVLNSCIELSGDMQGMWYFLHDNCGEKIVREITVGAGHNGGPILEYPEMIISAQVF